MPKVGHLVHNVRECVSHLCILGSVRNNSYRSPFRTQLCLFVSLSVGSKITLSADDRDNRFAVSEDGLLGQSRDEFNWAGCRGTVGVIKGCLKSFVILLLSSLSLSAYIHTHSLWKPLTFYLVCCCSVVCVVWNKRERERERFVLSWYLLYLRRSEEPAVAALDKHSVHVLTFLNLTLKQSLCVCVCVCVCRKVLLWSNCDGRRLVSRGLGYKGGFIWVRHRSSWIRLWWHRFSLSLFPLISLCQPIHSKRDGELFKRWNQSINHDAQPIF